MLALAVFPCLAVSLEGAVTEAAHRDDVAPHDVYEGIRMFSDIPRPGPSPWWCAGQRSWPACSDIPALSWVDTVNFEPCQVLE